MNGADAKDTRGFIWHNSLWLSTWSIVAAFGAYACMYAFRKPFGAAEYAGALWNIDYKGWLIAAQTTGYMLSKFIGIKVVSEARPASRVLIILVLVGIAEVGLLLFGIVPKPFNILCFFINGLPLGMVFGLVISFLEGRRQTEALAAGLCLSFILADGYGKAVGTYLLNGLGVSEFWMPSLAGLIFAPALLGFLWMLSRIPPPSQLDVAARNERVPLDRKDRWRFFTQYALGLSLLLLIYLLTTVLRSMRSDFGKEIWTGAFGRVVEAKDFATSETIVGVGVMIFTGAAILIRSNRRAFFSSLAISMGGFVLLLTALGGLATEQLSGLNFMVLYGVGLYLPYVAVQTTIFERLIAMTRDRGNLGYLITLADAFGYLGYVILVIAEKSLGFGGQVFHYFVLLSWILGGASLLLLIPCWRYFATRQPVEPEVVKL